ncbi:hypothetical protein [Litorimonas sp. WD9-15]|uniref:hypothetical protein n=1 Tax=Litorimonas sp. WD9-15 TaxID=3418716 RepID=UPI003D017B48
MSDASPHSPPPIITIVNAAGLPSAQAIKVAEALVRSGEVAETGTPDGPTVRVALEAAPGLRATSQIMAEGELSIAILPDRATETRH